MISKKSIKIFDKYDYFYYASGEGTYFIIDSDNKINDGYTCREEFDAYFSEQTRRVCWFKSGLNIKRINKFFSIIQRKLKLKQGLTFYPTNNKDVVVISIPAFWRETLTRRQLFTLFLRATNYYTNDFNKAISSYSLARSIKPFIEHFLKGNVISLYDDYDFHDHDNNGLVDYITNQDKDFIYSNLVKKKIKAINGVEMKPFKV